MSKNWSLNFLAVLGSNRSSNTGNTGYCAVAPILSTSSITMTGDADRPSANNVMIEPGRAPAQVECEPVN